MNFSDSNTYQPWGQIAAQAEVDERVDFIRRTYAHLLAAILAFAGLEAVLLQIDKKVADLAIGVQIGQIIRPGGKVPAKPTSIK